MGIFGALTTAVTGLRSQSFALENISGNIANSQTTGFKRVDTSFSDLVPDAAPSRQLSGAVQAFSRATNGLQGDIQNATTPTFMAINGEGYFQVAEVTSSVDGRPVFSGVSYYTRRGDFALDRDGFLVNGAGYYLMALDVDPSTGNVSGSVPSVISFDNDFMPARATTEIMYRANLADYPLTTRTNTTVPQSELLDPALFATNPITSNTVVNGGGDLTRFIETSISGGAITAFDANGAPVDIQLRWAKTESDRYDIDPATAGMQPGTDTWSLFYLVDSNPAAGAVAWRRVPQDYEFSTTGQLTTPATGVTTIPLTSVNGMNIGPVVLNHANGGLTQFADPDGNAEVTQIRQDGYPAGQLVDIRINESGRILAAYTNGQSQEIAAIPLFSFNGESQLRRLDGGTFAVTSESGPPLPGATGRIVGQALEGSNADIADEFTKLIVTQQAYAANTRIVSTASDMLQEALNMIR